MRFRGLRSQLLVATLLTLAAGLCILVTTGNVLLASTVSSDNRQHLSSRLDAQVAALSEQGGRVRVRDTLNDESLDVYGWVYVKGRLIEQPSERTPRLSLLAARLEAAPSARSAISGSIMLGSRPVHVGTDRNTVATVVAGVDIAQLEALRQKVLFGSIALALLVLAGAALVIRRVLAAALAPVQQMTREADEWEAHDLDRRFGLGVPRDELTALAATLDHLLGRIAASRRHEQRFAAEVAHELRTPLAAIRGTAELAAQTSADDDQVALSEIVAHSDRMATTLDTLIAHARREMNPATDGVDLASVVESFPNVTLLRPNAPVPRVEGDAGLIRQLLAPLVDNAERHAVSGVTVELQTGTDKIFAVVRDDGPGVDPDIGLRVFLPGVRGPEENGDGAGLGLPLARRLAQACGGEIQLGEGPGGCFVVVLPVSVRSTSPFM